MTNRLGNPTTRRSSGRGGPWNGRNHTPGGDGDGVLALWRRRRWEFAEEVPDSCTQCPNGRSFHGQLDEPAPALGASPFISSAFRTTEVRTT